MSEKEKATHEFQSKITKGLEGAFESVVNERNDYYQNNPTKIPQKTSEMALVNSSAMANAAISGSSSLIPGPWGMVAVIPEVMLVTRNQIALIYDIAAANGKKDLMTKDLALMVFASAVGTSVGGLAVIQGGKILVKRSSLRILQKIIFLLGGKISQQVLKSMISKWLPGVGAIAMAAWSRHMTKKVGEKAIEIFSSDIEFEDSITDIKLVKRID
jgi:uncharacterized protein (DUF697 family)